MPRHAARHRMNGELHVHTFLRQRVRQFANLVLRLRHSHPVAGDDHDAARHFQNLRRFLRSRRTHRPRLGPVRRRLQLAERAKQDVGERPVHRLTHDDRKDEARRTIQRARNNQQLVVERETHRAGRKPGVRVEQRNHCGHIRAADRHDEEYTECHREDDEIRKEIRTFRMQYQIDTDPNSRKQHAEIDEQLPLVSDGPARQDLL